jgi:hypothetical protein
VEACSRPPRAPSCRRHRCRHTAAAGGGVQRGLGGSSSKASRVLLYTTRASGMRCSWPPPPPPAATTATARAATTWRHVAVRGAAALVSFAWRVVLRTSGVSFLVCSQSSSSWTAPSLVHIAKLALTTSQRIVAFELQRALLYSRPVSDQRGRQVESRASYKISSFFLHWRSLDDPNSDLGATNTRFLPSRLGLPRVRAPGRA